MGLLQTTSNEHIKNLHVHLTSNVPSVLARNILLLKILSSDGFNPDCERDIAFLWDVWYNLEWQESTRKRFLDVVKELINGGIPENVSIPKSFHLKQLTDSWNGWSSVLSKPRKESKSLMERIQKER